MNRMAWERARSEKQKGLRVSEIVNATAKLYKTHRFEEVSFALIAKEAKFTRSNLYKYFNSKEEIFLELLKHDMILWRKRVLKAYEKEKALSVEEFASIWVKVMMKHERLLDLISVLFTFLEKNSSIQSLFDFKKRITDELAILSNFLCSLFPSLTVEKAVEFINLQMALATGLFPMTNLSEKQRKVLENDEFKHLKMDFELSFENAIKYLLNGALDRGHL